MIQGLPPTNARERELTGHHWTDETALLAIIADRVGDGIVVTAKVNGAKGVHPTKPLPRPWDEAPSDRADWDDPEWVGHVGEVEPDRQIAAIEFLMSLSPKAIEAPLDEGS